MNKILFIVVLSLFCFAFGIYFQSNLPVGNREIASLGSRGVATPGKVDLRISKALKACLGEKATAENLEVNKVVVDGRNWAIVSVDCVGTNAKNLYDAVAPYSTEQYVSYSDGRKGVARFFGRLYPPSQCVQVIRTSKGNELNLYSCSIRIDLDHELIAGLKL